MARGIIYKPERADAIIAFLELLPLTDDADYGKNFTVEPFLESWLREIYEPHWEDTDTLVTRRAALTVARKNGKSYVIAGLLLAHLVGPEATRNGQLFTAALDREQAGIVFDMAAKMIEMRPALARHLTVTNHNKTIKVTSRHLRGYGSRYRALSSDSGSKHGLGANWFCYDELGEAPNAELLNTLLDSQQAIKNPLAFAISTQNPDPEHCLSRWLKTGSAEKDKPLGERRNPAILAHIHAADEGCDIGDREQWVKANPALQTWKSFDAIETAYKFVLEYASEEHNFRRRYLNQQVSQDVAMIAARDWKECAAEAPGPAGLLVPGEKIYLAYDGAATIDLAALVAVSAENGSRIGAWFWKPKALLEAHGQTDKSDPQFYVNHATNGWLEAPEGKSINPRAVATHIAKLCQEYEVLGLAYDGWNIKYVLQDFEDIGFAAQEGPGSGLNLIRWGQGFFSMSPALTAFQRAVVDGELKHNSNPLLTWNVLNAIAIQDAAGNRKLDKSKRTQRIDGAQALAMAIGAKSQLHKSAPDTTSLYENEDYRIELI
jgi:phage terminase large subunit-like protein